MRAVIVWCTDTSQGHVSGTRYVLDMNTYGILLGYVSQPYSAVWRRINLDTHTRRAQAAFGYGPTHESASLAHTSSCLWSTSLPPSIPVPSRRAVSSSSRWEAARSSVEISGEHHPAAAIALPLLLAFYLLIGPPSASGRRWPAVSACDPHVKELIYLCLVSYHMISSSKHDSIFNFSVNCVLLKTENLIFLFCIL